MRTFIAALEHETNSFSPIPTTRDSFGECLLYTPQNEPGRDPEKVWMGYSDFIKIANERGHAPLISLAASAQPGAPTRKQDYEDLRDEILGDLRSALPVDMVLLFMHGAQMAEGYDDCEGDVLARIRAIVGSETPIGCELDLHCNISPAMLEAATILMTCKEYPHTDFPERARDLYTLIQDTAEKNIVPVMSFHPIAMLSKFFTTHDPMKSFVRKIKAMEGRNGILSISLAHSFPWSDTADTGAGVLIVTNGVRENTQCIAQELAQEFFSLRTGVYDKSLGIDQALDKALSLPAHPIVIADSSDNAGGGAPGDATFILQAMLERNIDNAALAMICDPETVSLVMKAGIGASLTLDIGGKHGEMSGPSLHVHAHVLAVCEVPTQQGLEPGRPEALGPSVAVRVDGIDIVLNSIRQQVFSPDVFSELGIDPASKKVLVIKSSQHFYTLFAPLVDDPATDILYCDAPGALNSQLGALPYTKIKRPMWPLDDLQWTTIASSSKQKKSTRRMI
ncbi:MAG: microcystin LR degradation protein MlrC-like protein [Robiginitomaculum sp.]|nr:MAG: microcystin LR degradation protein MlrC-like protein [Robiginitomaculum sp.]